VVLWFCLLEPYQNLVSEQAEAVHGGPVREREAYKEAGAVVGRRDAAPPDCDRKIPNPQSISPHGIHPFVTDDPWTIDDGSASLRVTTHEKA